MANTGKIARGQVLAGIPERDWNRFLDAARLVLDVGQAGRIASLGAGQLLVKNSTGSDLEPNRVIGLTSFASGMAPADNLDGFRFGDYLPNGVTVVQATHLDRWAVTEEAIPNGEIGICRYSGITVVKTSATAEPTTQTHVTCASSSDLGLLSTSGRGRIIMGDVISGAYWALVNLSNLSSSERATYIGYPTTTHATGTVVTYNVWQVDTAGPTLEATTGPVQKQAFQASLFPYKTTELCGLSRIDTKDGSELYLSWVHPYQDCETGVQIGVGPSSVLEIASNTITVTSSHHLIQPEGGPGSGLDEVDQINGGTDGMIVAFEAYQTADDIRFRTGVGGNVHLPANFLLDHESDQIVLMYNGNISEWIRFSFVNTD